MSAVRQAKALFRIADSEFSRISNRLMWLRREWWRARSGKLDGEMMSAMRLSTSEFIRIDGFVSCVWMMLCLRRKRLEMLEAWR